MGKSIIDELIIFRIKKTKKLLANTNYPLTKIAEKCGYSSDTYLIKQFKRIEGITPNEYRENQKTYFNQVHYLMFNYAL